MDTLSLILNVVIHAAHVQDREGAKLVLPKGKGPRLHLHLIWADGGYGGQLVEWLKNSYG